MKKPFKKVINKVHNLSVSKNNISRFGRNDDDDTDETENKKNNNDEEELDSDEIKKPEPAAKPE